MDAILESSGAIQPPHLVEELRGSFRGDVITRDDPRYDQARRVWNGSIDKHPLLIARCTGTADIVAAVRFARAHQLPVAVRGGAHNVAGLATCDDGLVIDLSRLTGIHVDPVRKRARAQPGLTWADVDRETQLFGLATPGGLVSMTGVAGFTLGGGFGWLSRKHALACDNLISTDLVTAEGEVVRASERENPDLFWGLRGGGGNFGIASSFEFRLHEVGPLIYGGLILHPMSRAREILRFMRDFADGAPDELFPLAVLRRAPAAPFLPPQVHGAPVLGLAFCYLGSPEEGERALRPVRDLGDPIVDLVDTRPYVGLQSMFDAAAGAGLQNYWKAEYLRALPEAAIDVLVDHAEQLSSPLSDVKLAWLGGAMSRVDDAATAFGHRGARLILNINSRWTDPAESPRHVEWTRSLFDALQPYSAGGVYVNFLGNEGQDRVRHAYGEAKYQRLVELKNRWDPTNFFRINQNIEPTTPPGVPKPGSVPPMPWHGR